MPNRRKSVATILMASLAILFTISLIAFPEQGMDAAVSGLKVFWDVVFPSLLPFFILSELLLGLGVVNALGIILEPLMRPLFSVPGVGAFALSMGLAAGYPMDAVITAKFRRSGLCSRVEGERLLAFTNTADPLFMFGAVAVGMFKSPQLGALLAVAHYLSSFVVGITFKFYGRREERFIQPRGRDEHAPFLLHRAVRAMNNARREDGRPFGKLLGDAVNDSIKTMLMIGGFIVLFSVFLRMLAQIGIISLVAIPLGYVFQWLHFSNHLVSPFIAGLFEIDIGSAAASVASAPLIEKVSVVSAIIAWSGLSVHAQVASVLTNTDIRMRPYFLARLYHAALAGLITYGLFRLGLGARTLSYVPQAITVMATNPQAIWARWLFSLAEVGTWAIVLGASIVASLLIYLAIKFKLAMWYTRSL